jgi:hypothetical protein
MAVAVLNHGVTPPVGVQPTPWSRRRSATPLAGCVPMADWLAALRGAAMRYRCTLLLRALRGTLVIT